MAIDIVERIGRRVGLKPLTEASRGACPFHEDSTPSFYVYPSVGTFRCYGCGEFGTVFDWLVRGEGLSFDDAVGVLRECL